jgi:hypothetical protein
VAALACERIRLLSVYVIFKYLCEFSSN